MIILGCRNLEKGNEAKKIILKTSPKTSIGVWQIDQSIFESVLAFGERLKTLSRLDGFIANAGLETVTYEKSEGYENSLIVNVISTTLVSILALPKLKETSKLGGSHTNLVIVGSMQHIFAPSEQLLNVPEDKNIFEALSDPKAPNMQKRYELTKLMVQQVEKELTFRLSKSGECQVVMNCVNPGWYATELSRYYDKGRAVGVIFSLIGRTAEAGSRTLVHAVTAGKETHGQYLSECLIKTEGNFVRSAEGEMVQKSLWKDLESIFKDLSLGAMALID
jgi:retinol dehydrogenase-12